MTALLAESEGVCEEQGGQEQVDDLDCLFDEDNEDGEEYKEGSNEEARDVSSEDVVPDLFGDVEDIENEERDIDGKVRTEEGGAGENLNRSNEKLQGLCFSIFSLNLQT